MARLKDKVHSTERTGRSTLESGGTTALAEGGASNTQMVRCMRVSTRKESDTGEEYIIYRTVLAILENSRITKCMDRESFTGMMDESIKVHGKMGSRVEMDSLK